MNDTMTRFLAGIASERDRRNLRNILEPIVDRYSSVALSSAGLVIKAGSSALAKTGSATFVALAGGVPVSKAGATDMPALSGTVTNNTVNVFCFFIDSAGTLTSAMGTAGATLAAVKFPSFTKNKSLVGFIIVSPTGGDFVGGTTALDDGTVLPAAVYCSPTGAFEPSVLV